ncbi:MAG: helix-turn-helix domain-containing protein [Proteobacteria bacterium]|nr:helix-turn-helix domain-containing protein [Pseudomonadota bacterium]
MDDNDDVFKALADPTRRMLLDHLFERDGQTLKELEGCAAMTRFGVMKHLRILEAANLVVTRKSGREKLHFLNPIPIKEIHDRWIAKYKEREASALLELKAKLEKRTDHMAEKAETTQVYRIVIKASAQAIWDAITKPEWSERYGYGGRVIYDLKAGGRFTHKASPAMRTFGLPEDIIVGEVVESDPPHRLVQTWHPLFDPDTTAEPPTRLTYEIAEHSNGICTLTVTHDVAGAPLVARMIPGGSDPARGGGGWPWILSDLKSVLETGKNMSA